MMIAEANGVPTVDEIAAHRGRSRQTVAEWFRRGCPRDSLEAVDAWCDENLRKPTDGTDPIPGSMRHARFEAELESAKQDARAKRIKNDQIEGRLVDRDEIVAEFADFLAQAKPLLEAMVDDIAKESPEELRVMARQVAKNATDRFFRKLAAWKPEGADGP